MVIPKLQIGHKYCISYYNDDMFEEGRSASIHAWNFGKDDLVRSLENAIFEVIEIEMTDVDETYTFGYLVYFEEANVTNYVTDTELAYRNIHIVINYNKIWNEINS